MAYSRTFTDALEFMWGDGFLSPGGPSEVDAIIGDVGLEGRRVLDIGSGLGGIDIHLARRHGAGAVLGIDVEEPLIEAARERTARHGLDDRISYELVAAGPLSFPESSFDVVFSKDSIVHIPDKPAFYRDVLRVLKPSGHFLASDWLFAEGAARHPAMIAWLAVTGLKFEFITPAMAEAALKAAGFTDIAVTNRNAMLRQSNRGEIETLAGPAQARLATLVGEDMARARLESARGRQEVLDRGILLPCHIRARKP